MSITQRQEEILKIVGDRTYISVNELARITYTSPSSIRRDLAAMQNIGLIKRSHGGVSLPGSVSGVAGFYDRTNRNIKEKRAVAKKAAELLREGQSILLDGSSTASFMLPYIAKLSSATLFTNNLETALQAIKLGIDTHCLGGRSVDGSAALVGTETYAAMSNIRVDVLFFSSQFIDRAGLISDSSEEENYLRRLMLKHANTTVFLCDSEKFGKSSTYKLAMLDEIDYAVFDKPYEELTVSTEIL